MNFKYLEKFLDTNKKFRLSNKSRVLKQQLYDIDLILNLELACNIKNNLYNIKTRIIDRLTCVQDEKCIYKNNNIDQLTIDLIIALICMQKINKNLNNGKFN